MTRDLHIDALSSVRAGRMVFSGLSAHVPAGTALVLSGPNGSGKSSLLRTLAGLTPLAEGDARYGPDSLRADRAAFQQNILYAGHLDAIKPALTARENLAFWGAFYGAETPVDEALAALNLSRLAETPAQILSAGQKRRLGLARLALIDRPVWLLDEPTVSLDAESSALVAALARAHCGRGGVVLAATHIDLGIEGAARLEVARFKPARAKLPEAWL